MYLKYAQPYGNKCIERSVTFQNSGKRHVLFSVHTSPSRLEAETHHLMNGGKKRWRGVEEEGRSRPAAFLSPLDQGVLGIDRPHLTSTRLASETNHIPNIRIDKRLALPRAVSETVRSMVSGTRAIRRVLSTIARSYQGRTPVMIPFRRIFSNMLSPYTHLCMYYWAYQVKSLYNRLTFVGAATNWWKRNVCLFRVSMTYNNLETLATILSCDVCPRLATASNLVET